MSWNSQKNHKTTIPKGSRNNRMKTNYPDTSMAATPQGISHKNGGSPGRRSTARRIIADVIAEQALDPTPIRYDTGVRFDSGVRYADPGVPVSDGAKVKIDISTLTDPAFAQYCEQHAQDMLGNALYPDPVPSAVDYGALLTQYETALTAADSARAASQMATASKNAARDALTSAMKLRGNYVQIASNGNTAAILSSGLQVQKARTPKGALPPPSNVRAVLGSVAGAMSVLWDAVAGNSGYLAQCSKDVTPREWSQLKRVTKPRLDLENLEIGTTYVFQLATAGGDAGQSPWSPEVKRAAA